MKVTDFFPICKTEHKDDFPVFALGTFFIVDILIMPLTLIGLFATKLLGIKK